MIKARVVGRCWATVQVPGLRDRKLLLLAPLDARGKPTGSLLVAVDAVSCEEGQTVMVSFGSAARNATGDDGAPVEACVTGIVEQPGGRQANTAEKTGKKGGDQCSSAR